ncbi:FAT4 [Mytilus edulis]|uniref:FAT4 n=1 Tax=Mytilus edulis TaxID=6550 RepID=A0A8S3UE82_MYTED|nr:FAT4 [Mytilus edulis]
MFSKLEGYPDKKATANFTVNVEDVDDQNPKFTKKSYQVDVAENTNSTPVTTSLQVKAIDQDTGINAKINYKLMQEIPFKGWFSVDQTSGAITVIKPPDRETCSQLTLFIKGYQVDNEALRYDVTWVDVTITDVDDNRPVIEKSVYNISIPENSPTGTNIVQVLATDKDESKNAVFSFHFVTSNTLHSSCNGLGINQATGMIKVQDSAAMDREKHPTLSCQVKAKGTHGKHLLSNASSITVNLVDENDNNPVFNMTEYSFYIKKNHTVGSIVGEVRANDKDLASDISYRVTDKSLQTFLVDSKTGKITLDVSLTEKFSKLYSFEIVASDGDKKAPRYTSVIVNVHVQDVNLHAPVFTQKNYHLNLMEDVAVGTDLIQIEATDKDPDDTLTYRITKSNSHFKINSTSVTVLDINDNAPKFQSKSYIFTNVIEEDSNRNVGTVLATDNDSNGTNSEITYSIELPWKANFSIVNGGKIAVIGKLDRESIDDTEGHIKFVVIATDHGQPSLTGTTEVTVEVTDINDNCPYINTQDLRSAYVFKELEIPKDFHHIQVEDMDKTDVNRKMTYSYIGRHDGFKIDQHSGNLSATKALEMEHTNNGQIKLTVTVSNNSTCKDNITATQTIVINVQDINRYSPQFTPNTYSLNVKENYTVGSKLDALRINATDRDTSPKYNTITYWIGKGDLSGHFYMDSKTAEIFLVKPLDYENQTKFVLTIYATDGHALYNGTSINATGSVTINVQNVNDNTPKFNQDAYLCKFDENSQTSKNGCTVKATDGDKDTLSYNLNNTMFKINHLTGDITVSVAKGLDYDDGVHKYMLQVLATDNGRPKLTGTAVVEVDVLNLNDNSPSFSNKTYTFKVMEDASVLTMVGIIQASDKDGDKLKYSIASNKPEFSLDSDTGLLTLKSSLIDKTNITFTVQAKDSNKTGTATVIVNVIDVNNHPPKFVSPVYTRTLPENVDADVVTTVKATDLDNSYENRNISYLIESAWRKNFTIDAENGIIKVRGHLDREVLNDRGLISFAVMATDQGNPPLTGTTTVAVTVTDKNDNCPYYDDEDKEVTYVFEEYAKPQKFHDFLAKDDDKTQANRNCIYNFETLKDLDLNANATLRIQGKVKQVNHLKFLPFNTPNNCTGKLKPAIQEVKIIIQDVNDYSPRFNSSKYLFTVEEDAYQRNQIKIGSVHAFDEDATVEYNTVHYGISNGNSQGNFHIDKLNGDILLVKKLDYETEQNYTLMVTATDGKPFNNTGNILTSTVTVEITVNDINDNPPVFDKDVYRCTVSENSTGSIAGCNLIVTDMDIGVNGQYDVSVTNDTKFKTKRTGHSWQVELVRPLDFDRGQKIYYLNVSAEDKGTPSLHSSVLVEVVVTNINDNKPYFISASYTFTIPEDIETNVLIGRVMTDDVDHDKLTFSVTGSDFKVDNMTGNLYTNAVFVNKLNSLYFHVNVFDGIHTSTTNVTVHIEDVNNNIPHFLNSSYHFGVEENVNNTQIGKVQTFGESFKAEFSTLSSRMTLLENRVSSHQPSPAKSVECDEREDDELSVSPGSHERAFLTDEDVESSSSPKVSKTAPEPSSKSAQQPPTKETEDPPSLKDLRISGFKRNSAKTLLQSKLVYKLLMARGRLMLHLVLIVLASGGPPSSAKKRKNNYGKPQNKPNNSGKSSVEENYLRLLCAVNNSRGLTLQFKNPPPLSAVPISLSHTQDLANVNLSVEVDTMLQKAAIEEVSILTLSPGFYSRLFWFQRRLEE